MRNEKNTESDLPTVVVHQCAIGNLCLRHSDIGPNKDAGTYLLHHWSKQKCPHLRHHFLQSKPCWRHLAWRREELLFSVSPSLHLQLLNLNLQNVWVSSLVPKKNLLVILSFLPILFWRNLQSPPLVWIFLQVNPRHSFIFFKSRRCFWHYTHTHTYTHTEFKFFSEVLIFFSEVCGLSNDADSN